MKNHRPARSPAARTPHRPLSVAIGALLLAAAWPAGAAEPPIAPKPASTFTAAKNAAVLQRLPFADRADYETATRGLVAAFNGQIKDANGTVTWDSASFGFLADDKAPDSVNPSLWRVAQLNAYAGLFKVTERVYQLRGMDVSNMTVIEGDTGIIVVDPLVTSETARAAIELYYQHRARKPVVAVIYTHSHVDHFGGVRGVVDEAQVKAGKVQIVAPTGFMEEAISENVLAGAAMLRRAQYQFASNIARGARGLVDSGMGKATPSGGTFTLIAPTLLIAKPYETHRFDGVEIEFQLTPGTEAPAEMNFYLPQLRALCMAENVTQMMHNILTPRGALVRDAKAWGRFIDASLARYGQRSDVMFASHNWPTWGGEHIRAVMADHRDMYTFLNDRTLHLANQGLTPMEISEAMTRLPGALESRWYLRSYYGTLSHNSRAVYQRYLGWYDANPANLNPLPPVETGTRYVAALGGSDAVLKLVRAAIDQGDYRWAAQLGNNLVFAEPDNRTAREAQADALEQLGYQAEGALWRNMYLAGAAELRNGLPPYTARGSADLVVALTPAMVFDFMAVRLNADKAVDKDLTLNWVFSDLNKAFALTLRNGVLTYREDTRNAQADATVTMSKQTLDRITLRQIDFQSAVAQGEIKIEGDGRKLGALLGMLDNFNPMFNIVTP